MPFNDAAPPQHLITRSAFALVATAALVGYFWWQGERFIAANGPTFDEGVHLTAGYVQWTRGELRMNREDPPLLKFLWAAPLVFGEHPRYPDDVAAATNGNHWHVANAFLYYDDSPPSRWLAPARRVNLALGCGLVLLVGWWVFRLTNSQIAGVAACAFAAFDPTLLALSCVLTTDLGLAFFSVLSAYLLWEYSAKPRASVLMMCGIALGLLLGAKFSAIAVVGSLGVAGLVFVLRGGTLALPGTVPAPDLHSRLGAAGELAFRFAAIAFVTLAATYGIVHVDQWGAGLKFQLTRGEIGDGVAYLNGELSRSGWWHYFLIVLPMKLPLGLLIAVLMGCISVFSMRRESPPIATGGLCWLLFPPLFILVAVSLSRVNLGVRVAAPILPFLYVLAAQLAGPGCCLVMRRSVLAGCLTWCGFASWMAGPHQIAYFNELAGGSTGGLRFAADSNLDWGQGLPLLKQHMEREGIESVYLAYFGTDHPEAYGIRYQALPGYGRIDTAGRAALPDSTQRIVVAVSVNHLVGLMLNDPELYSWLRHREPTAVLGGSIYVFDLTGDTEAIAQLQRSIRDVNGGEP